ncbi:ribosome biogenesis GTP-binding protein YihA/YsxC [Desulfonatronovibrio hydrogenovorans]|uniref:ribosome biogenesis GTP-binding protein YihA/YsxC n=1 Tax=Desulfonatronovibrio hydrogenovorans TaxID=53245 RepID=UPI00048F057F|nr:ribosome biogenesis GTP-binding protein YihA/YsxC [Desulfonatronovibrio hydrogenovorans]
MRELILEKTAYTADQLSGNNLPQVALAGRSNVGKSSLINTLGQRRGLAKISSTPGKTRSINFYLVKPENFYLVDLPGYGYAKRSKSERENWGLLIQGYLEDNPYLKSVVLLIDSRIPPQVMDMELAQYIRSLNLGLIPVLTKTDKCKQKQISDTSATWSGILGFSRGPVIFSSKTGKGKDTLWARILAGTGL